MRSHSPKRLIITAVATLAVAGAALLPGVASADGGPKPRPQASAIHGTATYGDAGEQAYLPSVSFNPSPGATSY
jgi:hypothetical protein